MTEFLLSLIVDYGGGLLFLVTYLSCLAIPVPSSLLMLAGGGFVASGDLTALGVIGAAYLGAMLGDQTGFHLGKRAGDLIETRFAKGRKRAALRQRALDLTTQYGGSGVFLSRWLFSPLGPYVNFVGGAAGLNWFSFTMWGAIGEAVWVSLYVGLGYAFADRISELADLLGSASGFMAAGVVTAGLGYWLRSVAKQAKSDHQD